VNPVVSIVVPAYNHARYLTEAIESILNQDYEHIELIVLDDGSTDMTSVILQNYGNRFHWESQNNMGQANTLNKGWRMAKGEILAYLSADDALLPKAVSTAVACLQSNPDAVLCYPDFQLIDHRSRVIRHVAAPEYDYKEMVTKLICAPGAGAFFRRSAYAVAGEWDPTLRQFPDYEYWLRLGLHGTFIHIHEYLAAFRVHEESQSFAQVTVDRAEEALRLIMKYYELLGLPAEIISARSRSLASANIVAAQFHLRSGRYTDAFIRVKNAIVLSPRTLLSPRVLRMLGNGLVNRPLHRILWSFRSCMKR
jgi:glycosyltransferase involved in cell wall biosynthesis